MDNIRTRFLNETKRLPLVVEPLSADVDLVSWATQHRAWIEEQLPVYGGILFRGFNVVNQQTFESFVGAVCSELLDYKEGATPRTHLGDKVYTSTEFPAARSIMPHNELSYVRKWPTRIWFCCMQPAERGGETPICDVRRVFDRIDQRVKDEFTAKGWMLTRNFGNGLSLSWTKSFGVESEEELERYCDGADIRCEWPEPGRLRTRQVRPAVIQHPQTGEWLWFNHVAFWNLRSLPPPVRESMLQVFSVDEVPYNTYYGDGSGIGAEDIDAINAAYDAELVSFSWERGDVLMLDNMLVAHGRAPFEGARKVIVSMGDPYAG